MKLLNCIVFLLFYGTLTAQTEIAKTTIERFNGQGNLKFSPQSQVYGFDNSEIGVIGNGYLDTFWHKGEIVFYPEKGKVSDKNQLTIAEDLEIRWDIYRNEVDVLLKSGVHATLGNSIYEFSYQDRGKKRIFRNTAAISNDDDLSLGFYEILTDGKLLLLKKHEAKLEKPTFNPALNVGSKDYTFKKTDALYYAKKRVIDKLKMKENFILEELMPNQKEAMKKYIADNNLSVKKEAHLSNAFNQYNEYCGKTK
jgi:hypothetical protein